MPEQNNARNILVTKWRSQHDSFLQSVTSDFWLPLKSVVFAVFERPLYGKADFRNLLASPMATGLLRESAMHRYAQSCNLVRERLVISQ